MKRFSKKLSIIAKDTNNYLKKILSKKNNFQIPVICVGNIYLGGTGKTPLSIELFSILRKLKKKPAFIRKKYLSFQGY